MSELPQDRVRSFVEAHDEWDADEDYLTHSGGYSSTSPASVRLTKTDLKDVLNELEEHQQILIEIDKALDRRWAGELVTEAEALDMIRKIMGNHTNERK